MKVNARVATLEDKVASLEKGIHAAVAVIEMLKAEVADLHYRRRVSRQQATDQDPEWFS